MISENQQQRRISQILRQLGRAYLERHQFSEAFEKFQQLAELEPENPETLMDLAMAAIGLKDISDEAQAIYHKALHLNPESEALKVGLATLFMQQEVQTDFSMDICEQALKFSPPNSQKLHEFLSTCYETRGAAEKARVHRTLLLLNQKRPEEIYQYFEDLWLNGHFETANELLQNSHNGALENSDLYAALTQAYQLLQSKATCSDSQTVNLLLSACDTLQPEASFLNLHQYMLLKAAIPEKIEEPRPEHIDDTDEYQFILEEVPLEEVFKSLSEDITPDPQEVPPFCLQKDLLDKLNRADGTSAPSLEEIESRKAYFCLQLSLEDQPESVSNLLSHFTDYFQKVSKAILYRTDDAILGFCQQPLDFIEAMPNLLNPFAKMNQAVPANQKARLICGIKILHTVPRGELDILANLVELSHLWRMVIRKAPQAPGSATFILQADEKWLEKNSEKIGPLVLKGPERFMPGRETKFAEMVWQDVLANISKEKPIRIKQFALETCLQDHAQYRTYLGRNTQLERPVICKVLPPQSAMPYLQDPNLLNEFFEQFKRQGRISSPHLATLFDMGQQDNMLYLVREYVEGKPLSEFKLSPENKDEHLLQILQKLSRGLQAIQREGLAHLNLKPSNIWVSEGLEVKMTDFRCKGFGMDSQKTDILFPAQWKYTAPEILTGKPGDWRSDIYSLGVIAYEMIVGKHPYDTTINIKSPGDLYKAKIDSLVQQIGEAGQLWNDLVMKAMALEPEDRYESPEAFAAELKKIQMQVLQKMMGKSLPPSD